MVLLMVLIFIRKLHSSECVCRFFMLLFLVFFFLMVLQPGTTKVLLDCWRPHIIQKMTVKTSFTSFSHNKNPWFFIQNVLHTLQWSYDLKIKVWNSTIRCCFCTFSSHLMILVWGRAGQHLFLNINILLMNARKKLRRKRKQELFGRINHFKRWQKLSQALNSTF